MDHVKGALEPLASMVMEFPKLVECKKPSEAGRELIASELESMLKNEGEGGIGFIEIVKQHEFKWQMEINKELESPNLKRDFVSLYSKLTSLIREGDYTEDLDRSEEVKVWAEARELSYDLEDVVEKFVVYIQESRRVGRLPEIDTLKKLMQKMANLQLGENVITDEMINIATRPASITTIKPGIQAFYTEIPGLVGLSGNMDSFIHLISDDNVAKVTSEVSEKLSGTEDKMSSNDPGLVPDDYQYEDRNMPSKIKPKVACVVGFGGLGKTTLVRTYYDKIKKKYSCKAFVTVGQNADEKKVLMDILLALDKEKKEKKYTAVDLLKLDEWELTKELQEFLCKQRRQTGLARSRDIALSLKKLIVELMIRRHTVLSILHLKEPAGIQSQHQSTQILKEPACIQQFVVITLQIYSKLSDKQTAKSIRRPFDDKEQY